MLSHQQVKIAYYFIDAPTEVSYEKAPATIYHTQEIHILNQSSMGTMMI